MTRYKTSLTHADNVKVHLNQVVKFPNVTIAASCKGPNMTEQICRIKSGATLVAYTITIQYNCIVLPYIQ